MEHDTKYILRHWRGNGQVIADIKKDKYHDYPKYRNMRPFGNEVIIKQITRQQYFAAKNSKEVGQECKEFMSWYLNECSIKPETKNYNVRQLYSEYRKHANPLNNHNP